MKIPVLALALVTAPFAFADEVVTAIELPRATLSELAGFPAYDPPRVIEHRTLPPLRFRYATNAILESPRSEATIAAPRLAATFDSSSSKEVLPADASGAVGPQHVVSALNSGIIVQNRSGATLKTVTLAQFWNDPSKPVATYYDPRIAYDKAADRWVVMSIYDEQAMMIAVTLTGDPAGTWQRYKVSVPGADFSHLALTKDTVVATTLTGADLENTTALTVQKDLLYAAPTGLSFTRRDVTDADATPVSSDNSTNEYMVWAFDDQIWVRRLEDTSWQYVGAPADWRSPYFNLPQLGGGHLDGPWGTVEAAVEQNGAIYVTMTRTLTIGQTAIVWCKFDPGTLSAQWGTIETPNVYYAYPSLAVSPSGAMLIGFGIFSSTQYASSGYVYRDLFGRISNVGSIRNGDSRVTIDTRWGDYTTTVVDPLDSSVFWTAQMHAKDATWGTTWSRIETSGGGRRRVARH